MNETLRVIANRRSVRKYKPEQITDFELQQILDAGLRAPNARNAQKWHFTVVQNKDLLDRMVKSLVGIMKVSGDKKLAERANDPGYHTFHNAPTVIFVSGEEGFPYAQNDCSLAGANILIAAESLNIGSCWIGSVLRLFMTEEGNKFLKELGVPEGYLPVCAIALGYKADENKGATERSRDVINFIR
ncbi:MAG: hypothetical protein CVU89_04780 [Firmicutes bacterium HGW-Firmicutes-14]|jgi:nitroreductase|nr:MAG: hypothetical protein CVU89_04780 [Firmicutes bacterium HGW-Firmicutes-14]